MLVVTANLTYVPNGVFVEVMATDVQAHPDDVPVISPKISRRVFVEIEEGLAFVAEEIARYHPGKGDLAEVLSFTGNSETKGNA